MMRDGVTNERPRWAEYFPARGAWSLVLTCGVSAGAGVMTVVLGTSVFRDYGWALFLGTPMAMGFFGPLLHGIGGARTFGGLMAAAVLAQLALFSGMLVFGIEGLGCMIMASPLWLTCAVVGAVAAYPVHLMLWRKGISARGFPVVGLIVLMMTPLWMGAEHVAGEVPEVWSVTTVVEIDAPPEVVWRRVIAFPDLAEPKEWLFKLGVAYPKHAEIVGQGVGAVRYCVFSTGAFVEPIKVWEENRRLAFDVAQSPPSMKEMSLWDIHPAHLENYLVSLHGEFRLIDLGNGRTRLEGTTWYCNRMHPAAYWRLWSDSIIHGIHERVLGHIKGLSEADVRGSEG